VIADERPSAETVDHAVRAFAIALQ